MTRSLAESWGDRGEAEQPRERGRARHHRRQARPRRRGGPALTHGEMKFGAGVVADRQHGAAGIVDRVPGRSARSKGRSAGTTWGRPSAMGHSEGQLAEMEKIIDAADVDMVVIGTPIDLRGVITISEPAVRVRFDLEILSASRRSWISSRRSRGLTDHPAEARAMERVVGASGGTAAASRRRGHIRGDVSSLAVAAERVADIAAAVGGRRHARQRPAGRPDPAAAGGARRRSCTRCRSTLRRREPGADRLPVQVTIGDVFFERGMERPVATILTLTRVRPKDPAFRNPTKFVGPFYEEGRPALEAERGYMMKADPHGGWRRVVPCPKPYSIVETPVIERLVGDGTIVIASGGGGDPRGREGPRLIGKEGVVDKDLAAAILAHEVRRGVADPHGREEGPARVRLALPGGHRPHDRRRGEGDARRGRVRRRLDGPEGAGGRRTSWRPAASAR